MDVLTNPLTFAALMAASVALAFAAGRLARRGRRPAATVAVALALLLPSIALALTANIAQRRLTNLLIKGDLILHSGDYISNDTDDFIVFNGSGGALDVDLTFDLDGLFPEISSASSVGIRMPEPFGTTATAPAVLAAGVATFAVDSNVMSVGCDGGGNAITTITGGVSGQSLTLIGKDANCVYVDDNTHGANTIDLLGANEASADDEVVSLVFDGTSWYQSAATIAND